MALRRLAALGRRGLSNSDALKKVAGPLVATSTGAGTSPVTSVRESMRKLLEEPEALVVTREMEWGSILVGFEQANKYTIRAAPSGEVVGHIAEEDSAGKTVVRNLLKTHRSFRATIFDPAMTPLFQVFRPMYLISTSLRVEESHPSSNLLGEVQMHWHMWRRRYDLFNADKTQFARIDGGFLALDFELKDDQERQLAAVNRDFTGFAREIFTDAGQYIIHLKTPPHLSAPHVPLTAGTSHTASSSTNEVLAPAGDTVPDLTLAQRAVCLGTAISVDFDYFSRHSRSGGGFMSPFFLPHMGGGSPVDGQPTESIPDGPTDASAPGPAAMATSAEPSAPEAPSSPFGSTESASDDNSFEEYDHGFEAPPEETTFESMEGGEEGGSAMGTAWSIFKSVVGDGDD